jgi:antitoxin component of MazEF toxin-antitoxin module
MDKLECSWPSDVVYRDSGSASGQAVPVPAAVNPAVLARSGGPVAVEAVNDGQCGRSIVRRSTAELHPAVGSSSAGNRMLSSSRSAVFAER